MSPEHTIVFLTFPAICILMFEINSFSLKKNKNQRPNLKGFEKHRKSEGKNGKGRKELNVTLIY